MIARAEQGAEQSAHFARANIREDTLTCAKNKLSASYLATVDVQ